MVEIDDLEKRVRALESWKSEQLMNFAVRQERDRHMDQRFDRIEQSVNEIKGYLLRIVWVIILGIIGSLITFIINGGVANV